MYAKSWHISLDPLLIATAALALLVVIGMFAFRGRRPSAAEKDCSKRPAMCKARFWITLVVTSLIVSFLIRVASKGHVEPAMVQHGLTIGPPRISIPRPPAPPVIRLPAAAQMQLGQQAAAVPIDEIRSAPAGKATFNGDPRNPVWKIEGQWETTAEDARRSAHEQAREELIGYLRSQDPPLRWVPPVSFVSDPRRRMVLKREEQTKSFPEIGTMRRYVLEMTLPTEARREIWRHESELLGRQRMLFLAKILAGLVAVLAATAGYLRLDEVTKGYYTGWLRLAAAGLLGAAALVLALLA